MLYIHIGLRKTGSTSIQRFCSSNTDLLKRHGVVYPQIGRDGATHHALKNEISAGKDDESVSKLVSVLEEDPSKHFLISSESFSTLPIEAIRRLVDPVLKVTDIKAILYLRNMTSTAVSLYNQATKRSLNIMSFDEYYAHGGGNEKKLLKVVETWGEAVGLAALRVRTLEPSSLAAGGLLTDLLDAVGVDPAVIDQADPESMVNANTGITWESAEYIREFTARSAALIEAASDREVAALTKTKRPRIELVEARALHANGRMAMIRTLRPKRFAHVVGEALDRAGPAPNAQYLTPDQAIELDKRYQDQLDKIGRIVPDTRLSHAAAPAPPPRPFEPTYLSISPPRRAAILDGITKAYSWDDVPPQLRDILLSMSQPATA